MTKRFGTRRGLGKVVMAATLVSLTACGGSGGQTTAPAPAAPMVPVTPTPTTPASTPAAWRSAIALTGATVAARGSAPGPNGSFYVVGSFDAAKPLTIGSETRTSAGADDIFVARIGADGALIWLKTFGGTAGDIAFDVDVDAAGNAYVGGRAAGKVTFGAFPIDAGDGDAILFKLDQNGNVQWVRQTSGTGGSAVNEVATDDAGNSAIVGPYAGPLTLGTGLTVPAPAAGTTDPFVAYYKSDGTPVWGIGLRGSDPGSSTTEAARGVSIAPSGRVFVTGPFTGQLQPTGYDSLAISSVGTGADCYLLAMRPAGTPEYLRRFGGPGNEVCRGVVGDSADGVRIAGTFDSTIFDGAMQLRTAGLTDIFVASINGVGEVVWSRAFGGTGAEEGAEVELYGSDEVIVFGNFVGSATLPSGTTLTSGGFRDNVWLRYAADGHFIEALSASGTGDDLAFSLGVQSSGLFGFAGTIGGGGPATSTTTFGSTILATSGQQAFFAVAQAGK